MLFIVKYPETKQSSVEAILTKIGVSFFENVQPNSLIVEISQFGQIEWLYSEFNREGYRLAPTLEVEVRKND